MCVRLLWCNCLRVSASGFTFSVPTSSGFRNQPTRCSETSWPFYCSSKLCSLSWGVFWLRTQPIWVCLTAGMFSDSVRACLSSAFCFLQHPEIINRYGRENERSVGSTADRVGSSTSVPGSSFILCSQGSYAASFSPSLYLTYLFRHSISHVRTCLWCICTVPRSNELRFWCKFQALLLYILDSQAAPALSWHGGLDGRWAWQKLAKPVGVFLTCCFMQRRHLAFWLA